MSNKNEETGIQTLFSKGKQIYENDSCIHIWDIFTELLDTIDTTAAISFLTHLYFQNYLLLFCINTFGFSAFLKQYALNLHTGRKKKKKQT